MESLFILIGLIMNMLILLGTSYFYWQTIKNTPRGCLLCDKTHFSHLNKKNLKRMKGKIAPRLCSYSCWEAWTEKGFKEKWLNGKYLEKDGTLEKILKVLGR